MSDLRIPSYWLRLRKYQGLDPADFRAFIYAGSWCVDNRTDGRIEPADLDLILYLDEPTVARLTAAGVLVKLDSGWLIDDYVTTQTTAAKFAEMAEKKANHAEEMREWRAAHQAAEQADKTADQIPVSTHVTAHVSDPVTTHRSRQRQRQRQRRMETEPPTKVGAAEQPDERERDDAAAAQPDVTRDAAAARQCQRCGSTSQLLSDGQGGWLCRKDRFG